MHDEKFKRTFELFDAPVFDTELGLGLPYLTTKRRLNSFVDKNWFFFFKDNFGSMYYSVKEMSLAGIYGFNDFIDKNYTSDYFIRSNELLKKTDLIIKRIDLIELKGLTDSELSNLIESVALLTVDVFSYFNTSQPQCIAKLENELKKNLKIKNKYEKEEVFLKITVSEKQNMINLEELEWLSLLNFIQNEFCLKKSELNEDVIRKGYPEIYRKIELMVEKYSLLGTAEGGLRWDEKHYISLLKQDINRSGVDKRIKEIKAYVKNTIKVKKNVFEKYKIGINEREIADTLAEIGHNRLNLRLNGWMKLYFYFKNIILKEVVERFDISLKEVRAMRLNEIIEFIKTGKIDRLEIKKRIKCFLMGMEDGFFKLYSGKEAEKLKSDLIKSEDYSKVKELKGKVAMKGFVVGKAVVFKWGEKGFKEKMFEMNQGDILVAGQTRPNLIPAIRKASAIVTDEGGITSHAAVVSRELKIPCIVGVHKGTDVFKDGDLIEVDADKGIVRKVG